MKRPPTGIQTTSPPAREKPIEHRYISAGFRPRTLQADNLPKGCDNMTKEEKVQANFNNLEKRANDCGGTITGGVIEDGNIVTAFNGHMIIISDSGAIIRDDDDEIIAKGLHEVKTRMLASAL